MSVDGSKSHDGVLVQVPMVLRVMMEVLVQVPMVLGVGMCQTRSFDVCRASWGL